MKEYISLLKMSYEEAIQALLKKYGQVTDDYYQEKSYEKFLNGKIKSITRGKYSRTSEGLLCHHIGEDKFENLGNIHHIACNKYPFVHQAKENLVYCNIIEHLILHALIAEKTEGEFGLNGYGTYILPMVKEWYLDGITPIPKWLQACKKTAFLESDQANELINYIDENFKVFQEIKLARLSIEKERERRLLEREEERRQEKIRNDTLRQTDFTIAYPNLDSFGIKYSTQRKKILDMLYDKKYKNTYLNKKDFYNSKLTTIRDDLLEELESLLQN